MTVNPEATESEGLRRSLTSRQDFDEFEQDLRVYERLRLDEIRDQHIHYCRSVAQGLSDGKTLEYIVSTITSEIPLAGMDVLLSVQLINYFMEEAGHAVRFDSLLNATIGGEVVVASGVTHERFKAYIESMSGDRRSQVMRFAEMVTEKIVKNFNITYLLQIIRADMVANSLDNVVFAEVLNECLEKAGSAVRFNQYLELMSENDN